MKNIYRQSALYFIAIMLLILSSHASIAQAKEITKADNSIHDRMYALVQKSKAVAIPATTAEMLIDINKNNPYKQKAVYSQTNMLKVLYNANLTKDDRIFFGNQLLKSNSVNLVAIHAEIKKVMNRL